MDGYGLVALIFAREVSDPLISLVKAIDKQLEEKIAASKDPKEKKALAALLGKTAIANCKFAYQDYLKTFGSDRFKRLQAKGAPSCSRDCASGSSDLISPDMLATRAR